MGATKLGAERSAALMVALGEIVALRDLRVDLSTSAIEALRVVRDEHERMVPFYQQRWKQPAESPPQDLYIRSLQCSGR